MVEQKNLRVVFTQKADVVFSDILKNNGIKGTDEEFFDGSNEDEETPTTIIRDATIAIVKKLIPEKNLIELLGQHLGVSMEDTEKIVQDIKERLLPLLKVYSDEAFSNPTFREKISKEIFGDGSLKPKAEPFPPYYKKIDIEDVEKNAEKMRKEGKNIMTEEKSKFPKKAGGKTIEDSGPDTYREPIE